MVVGCIREDKKMPSKSQAQQKFMGLVRSVQTGKIPISKVTGKAKKASKEMKPEDVEDFASTKRKGLPKRVKKEAKERNYKDEYKKFQSSTKSKKYRAELNKYNRQKGTYGNGDGKDASHKGGKIAGFEKESVNRGRREKSRLKQEQKITEGKLDSVLGKIEDLVKGAGSFMNVGKELKKAGIKYSFSTSMIPMYRLDKFPIAIVNKKYTKPNKAAGDRIVGDVVIGLLESVNRGRREKSRLKQEQKLREGSGSSKEAMGIAGFTGTRGKAVQDFIDKYELNAKKLFNFIKKGSLSQRLEFVSAIAGKPGNKIQKKIIKHLMENVDMKEQKIKEMIRNIIVDEGFAGGLKKEDRKKFDKNRRKQSEVLGYKLTGVDDLRSDIGDATIKEIRQLVEDIDVLNESTEFIVFYNRKQHKVKAKDLYTAKKEFISKNKVPMSKWGRLAIMSKQAYDNQDFRFESIKESKLTESSRRSNDFFNDSKHGKAIYKLLGGKVFKVSKVKKYLDTILDKLGDQKGSRVWDFIGKDVGLDTRKYDTQPLGKYEFALLGAIDDLYYIHIKESVREGKLTEGKKKFRVNLHAIGKAKYSIDFHDGKSKHKDGSPFWGIQIFKNKKNLAKAIKDYTKKGYIKEGAAGGLTYKKGKTITVTHKTSGKELVIIDKPNVRKEYEKIGYVAESKLNEAKETPIDIAKRVVKNKQHEKGLDLTTANYIIQLYDKLNPKNKKKIEKLSLKKLVDLVWKMPGY